VSCRRLMVCHRIPLGLSRSIKPCFGAAAQGDSVGEPPPPGRHSDARRQSVRSGPRRYSCRCRPCTPPPPPPPPPPKLLQQVLPSEGNGLGRAFSSAGSAGSWPSQSDHASG